jgi:hypothetical protein
LVAAQLPGGEPVSTEYGPDEPIPPLPAELHRLALRALDRVAAEDSEINEPRRQAWLDELTRLRQALTGVS